MSELANMEVKVTADIQQLKRQLSEANLNLIKTGAAFEKLGSSALQTSGYFVRVPQPINNTSKALAGAALQAMNLDSKLSRNLQPTANSSIHTMTNLSRVVQDLPYGFLGVANNLNPLLESFQRLRVETGSSALAIRALGSSLIGAGGLGLALSLGTTLIHLFTSGFQNFSKKAREASEESDKAAESFKSIAESVGKEAVSIAVIVEQLKTEVLTRKQRTAAIEELQRISPAYFSTLNAEKATIQQITAAYDDYSAAIIRSVETKVREKQLEDIITRRITLQDKLNKSVKVGINDGSPSIASIGGVEKATTRLSDAERKRREEMTKDASEYHRLLKEEKDLVQQIAQIKPVDFKIKKDAKGSEKDIETITEMLAEMRKELAFLSNREIVFKTDESENKIRVLDNAIEELFKKFSQTAQSSIVIQLQGEISEITLKKNLKFLNPKDAMPEIPPGSVDIEIEALPKITFGVPTISDIEFAKKVAYLKAIGITHSIQDGLRIGVEGLRWPEMNALYDSMVVAMERFNAQANQIILSTINSAFSGIGDAIGTAIAEGLPLGEQIFGNLFKVIADGMKQLGEAMIALGVAKIAVEKFAFAPGVGTVVAGVALVALSAALRSSLPKFAEGGEVRRKQGKITGPGTSTSDSIPALLSNGEYVIKAESVRKYGPQFFNQLNQGSLDKSISVVRNIKNINERNFNNQRKFSTGGPVFSMGGPVSNISIPNYTRNLSTINNHSTGGIKIDVEVHGRSVQRGTDLVTIYNKVTAKQSRDT